MQELEDVNFLFGISKQIITFYETPVIFLTMKDYSEVVFNTLCDMRCALQKEDKNKINELIVDFHLQWLHAVNDIENFRDASVCYYPKENMCKSINFTIEALNGRMKKYQRYMENNRENLKPNDQCNLQSDLEIVEAMHTEVTHSLLHKIEVIRQCQDELQFRNLFNNAVGELLQWLDKINDGLAYKLSKYVHVNVPHLTADLTKTLQLIVDELKNTNSEAAQKMLDDLKETGTEIGSMIRITTGHNLEITTVCNKITTLDDRIKRLEAGDKGKPSAALLALKHKKEYLEKKLDSLDNLKTTLRSLQKVTSVSVEDITDEELCVCEDFFRLRIFNHSLPPESREHLVTELCTVWDSAIFGERSDKSVISILSAADVKEEFTDELGTFYIDEHSRKIYKFPEDDALYQPNEHNQLVQVCDDNEHVYYYDECGRYFVDTNTKQRVYKAHAQASEYMMDSSGVLLKVKEVRDGITYHYDNFGRYYIDREGKHIYREEGATSEYESDGLGNLVRIRSCLDIYRPCPGDVNVTEDFRYLKEKVGKALRKCIGQVLLHQPDDPIKYLSKCLIKYRENIELSDKRARENEELNEEREAIAAEERAAAERAAMEAALLTQGGSEASFDSNLVKYTTANPDYAFSVGPSSK